MTVAMLEAKRQTYIKGTLHDFQSSGFLLKGTTKPAGKIDGRTVIWTKVGRGKAAQMGDTIEEVRPMNVGASQIQATLTDWQAADYYRAQDINLLSVNQEKDLQEASAKALGRAFDDMHFNLFDSLTLNATNNVFGDGTADIALKDVMNAGATITGCGGKSGRIFCPLPSRLFNRLKMDERFSKSTWVGDNELPLAKGVEKTSWGVTHFFWAPDELFTYDTGRSADAWKSATSVKTYMWSEDAVGFASNYDLQSSVTWENRMTAWLINNRMSGVVKDLQSEAICRLNFKFSQI